MVFFAVVFLAAVFAVVFLAAVFAVVFFAVGFLAAGLAAVLADVFFAGALAVVFLAVVFLAVVFLAAGLAALLAVVFFAVVFFAAGLAVLLAVVFLAALWRRDPPVLNAKRSGRPSVGVSPDGPEVRLMRSSSMRAPYRPPDGTDIRGTLLGPTLCCRAIRVMVSAQDLTGSGRGPYANISAP